MLMDIKNFSQQVIDENVDYTVKEITNVIKKYGPRESGNENCYAAQKHMKKELDTFCDETHFEEYKMAPKAFLMFTKFISVLVFVVIGLGAILTFTNVFDGFFYPQIMVSVAIAFSLFITLMEFLLYKPFCDVFHKKVTGRNLVATRKPTGEVKRRIVISGHCDSAYEWRHILYCKGKGMTLLMAGSIGSAAISLGIALLTIILAVAKVDNGFADFMINYSYYFHFFTMLNMITLFLFVDFKSISPGANDNLTGTYAALCALRMLEEGGVQFENTEVCAMITDGEEAGLRGAKDFAKRHLEEYTGDVETAVLCVDTLTDLEYLNVYSRDMTGTVKHSPAFTQLVMDSAIESGHNDLKFANVFFGSSDAAAFTQAGITAACLAAMDPTPADYYHNRRDSYDRLNPKAIKTGYEVIMSTIFNFDKYGLKGKDNK